MMENSRFLKQNMENIRKFQFILNNVFIFLDCESNSNKISCKLTRLPRFEEAISAELIYQDYCEQNNAVVHDNEVSF